MLKGSFAVPGVGLAVDSPYLRLASLGSRLLKCASVQASKRSFLNSQPSQRRYHQNLLTKSRLTMRYPLPFPLQLSHRHHQATDKVISSHHCGPCYSTSTCLKLPLRHKANALGLDTLQRLFPELVIVPVREPGGNSPGMWRWLAVLALVLAGRGATTGDLMVSSVKPEM